MDGRESNGIDSLLGGWAMPKAYFGEMSQRIIAEVESRASCRAATEEFAASAGTAIIYQSIGIKLRNPPSAPTLA
jgi:hypothetical protein